MASSEKDDGWEDDNDDNKDTKSSSFEEKARQLRQLQQERKSSQEQQQQQQPAERDLFIPIFAIVSLLGLFGSYAYEMVRLNSRGELYLPWQ
jgi:hypothetical protein